MALNEGGGVQVKVEPPERTTFSVARPGWGHADARRGVDLMSLDDKVILQVGSAAIVDPVSILWL